MPANRETQLLGQALRPFLTTHRLPVPEIRRLSEDNVREGFFSRAEVEALVPALPEDLRDFTRWGSLTGWRKGEIASLRWADVDREGRTIRLSWRKSKNRQARTMAMVGELAGGSLGVKDCRSDEVDLRQPSRSRLSKPRGAIQGGPKSLINCGSQVVVAERVVLN